MKLHEIEAQIAQRQAAEKALADAAPPTPEVDAEDEDPDALIYQDLLDAMGYLDSCRRLLAYLADKKLQPALSLVNRNRLEKLSVEIAEFLDEIESRGLDTGIDPADGIKGVQITPLVKKNAVVNCT